MIESILTYISYALLLLILLYGQKILSFWHGLSKLSVGNSTAKPTVTIIVPARNEERNIARCLHSLLAQRYPVEKLSIIVIDDQSTDNTFDIVKRISRDSLIPITLFSVNSFPEIRSPKLRALMHGIQHTFSSIIVTTDADCTAHPDWIRTLVSHFYDDVGVVTGLTVYEKRNDISSLFWGIQYLDFLSYAAIAAGSIGMGNTIISNGSNMAFRREAFDEAGGFETIKHINVGDDSLLVQTITKSGKWKARFVIEPEGIITTQPVATWREVFHQRARWAGQTAYYPASMMPFLIGTFMMFTLLAVSLPFTFFYWNLIPWLTYLLKFSIDFVTMNRFTHLTRTREAMKYFLPTAILHIPFVLISTVGGYFFSFQWKERAMKKESSA